MMRTRKWAAAIAAALVAGALVAPAPAGAAVLPNGFKSVGYLPSWAGDAAAVPYGKLTHVNYSFALPNADGTLRPIENEGKLRQVVTLGRQHGVKISLAVGGWNNGDDSAFEALAANAGTRTTFVNALLGAVDRYGLDGIDMDWEYPDPGTSANNYTALMQQLGSALHARGKLLTAAVVSEGGTAQGVQPAVFAAVDWLNIMAYDGGAPHANYDWSIAAANFWKSRGLPAAKTVLGVPFYSRPGYYTYAQLVAMDPANANRDCVVAGGAEQCYNGLPTIRRKTQWAMQNAGGIMNWELTQDATGANSLLNAIYETASGGGGGGGGGGGAITGLGGKCLDVTNGSTANGNQPQLWTCYSGSANQRWTRGSDGTVRALGKCLDVTGNSTANGAAVQLWDCFGGGNQRWTYTANRDLVNVGSGKCLDVRDHNSADGARLQIWDCSGNANQKWTAPA